MPEASVSADGRSPFRFDTSRSAPFFRPPGGTRISRPSSSTEVRCSRSKMSPWMEALAENDLTLISGATSRRPL